MSKRKITIASCVLVVFILLLVYFLLPQRYPDIDGVAESLSIPETMEIHEDGDSFMVGSSTGWVKAGANQWLELGLDRQTGRLAVTNRQSGQVWDSGLDEALIELQKVKGTLKSQLRSVYILEYYEQERTQRFFTNMTERGTIQEVLPLENGIQVRYDVVELGIRFVIQYELDGKELVVRVPNAGIEETGTFRMLSLRVLPFLGAVEGVEGGYLFVPEGPGGLIRMQENAEGARFPYESTVYKDASYPVFGMKRGDQAFVAYLAKDSYGAKIQAYTPGTISSAYSVNAQFIYREEYGQRLSQFGQPVLAFQEEREKMDWELRYRFLAGAEADYVGMAHGYRDYLVEKTGLKPARQVDDRMRLIFLGGDGKPGVIGHDYVTMTKFEDAETIVASLRDAGVERLEVVYKGWQPDGEYFGHILPVAKRLGGQDGLTALAGRLAGWDIPLLLLQDSIYHAFKQSDFDGKNAGIRGLDGTIQTSWGSFILKPVESARLSLHVTDRLEDTGITGLTFSGVGSALYRDYDKDGDASYVQTAAWHRYLLDYAREVLGRVAVQTGFAYTLQHIDHIYDLPIEPGYDIDIAETVPFYPIVLSGYVSYSSSPANLRDLPQEELLRSIEYGALPAFLVTNEETLSLRGTNSDYYSTHFAKWSRKIAEEYTAFTKLAPVRGQRISDHEKLEDGVYLTTYENGISVQVDYNENTFQIGGSLS